MRYTKSDLQQTVRVHPDAIASERSRWTIDAEGKTLWRLAVEITKKLMWKHKAYYCEQWDCGDYVVVLNADKIVVTGNKLLDKIYYRHSWYKGHLRETTLERMLEKHPLRVIEYAIRWMLPKNKQRKQRLKRLKAFVWVTHPYAQFSPVELKA
jgi:large subunit ribosomal protein L13